MLCGPLADEIALHSALARVIDLNVHLLTLATLEARVAVPRCAVPPGPCVAASDGAAEAFPPGEVAWAYGVGITQEGDSKDA